MKVKNRYLVTASVICLVISACGGGGGSAPSPSNSSGSNTGGSSTPSDPYVPAKLQSTVPNPPFAQSSDDYQAYSYLNDLRSKLGLGLLAWSPELATAAKNHQIYLIKNGEFSHSEDKSKPFFTGVDPTTRAKNAGYVTTSGVGEVLSTDLTKVAAIKVLLNSVYHRSSLLSQNNTDFGFSAELPIPNSVDNSIAFVLNIGGKTSDGQYNASDYVGVYPYNLQSNVAYTFVGEVPNPLPSVGDILYDKVGSPISISVATGRKLLITNFSLMLDSDQTDVPAYLLTYATDKLVKENEAFLIAKSPLQKETKYRVTFKGFSGSTSIEKSWVFTTGSFYRY